VANLIPEMAVEEGVREDTLTPLLPKDSTGMKVWRNKRNAFACLSLHYTSDPKKRDPAWKTEAKKGMPVADWEREYELSWETHSGKAVYGADFNETLHVLPKDTTATPGLPLIRGWDFGLTPACVILQLVGRRVVVLDEVIGENLGASRFVPQVLKHCATYFSGYDAMDFVDPAGFNRSESEEVSCVHVMTRPPNRMTNVVAGELTYEKRLGAVLEHLTHFEAGRPLLVLNPRCQVLIAGFKGGYQYPDQTSRRTFIRMDKPLKNAFSHPHDALQYACSKVSAVNAMMRRPKLNLTGPKYGFQGEQ